MALPPPLIVTVALDAASHAYFTELRNKHFPAYCNYMEAHLTFFHNLPSALPIIDGILKEASNMRSMSLQVTGIKNIGNGNAFTLSSNELQQLHKALQKKFDKYLIAQDRKKWWPHVTVQNKVTAYKAKQATDQLMENFVPFTVQAIGLSSWLYLKGPWQHTNDYLFNQPIQ